jgi:hypothetical protein
MVEVCTWDKAFTSKTHIVLYWYLFNRPDYQLHIAKEFADLRRNSDEFKGSIPVSLTYESNITNYLREMEEYNLVGIRSVEGRKHYYQALSFFYLDPFCIRTPKSKKKYINDHFEEYKECLRKLGLNFVKLGNKMEEITGEDIFSYILFRMDLNDKVETTYLPFFCNRRDSSVIPAQRIFQEYSCDLEEFMRRISHGKIDYIMLYELVRESFKQIHHLCNGRAAWIDCEEDYLEAMESGEPKKITDMIYEFMADEGLPGLNMLDFGRFKKMLDTGTLRLIDQYGVADWFGRDIVHLLDELRNELHSWEDIQTIEKECWNVLLNHIGNARQTVETQLRLYQQIQRGNASLSDFRSAQVFDIEGF